MVLWLYVRLLTLKHEVFDDLKLLANWELLISLYNWFQGSWIEQLPPGIWYQALGMCPLQNTNHSLEPCLQLPLSSFPVIFSLLITSTLSLVELIGATSMFPSVVLSNQCYCLNLKYTGRGPFSICSHHFLPSAFDFLVPCNMNICLLPEALETMMFCSLFWAQTAMK
jgi:hypothetical protein